MSDMKLKTLMYAFFNSGILVAAIQAKNKKQARNRTQLVSHLVNIPDGCKVKVVKLGKLCRAPIFFEKHLCALEDAIEDALAEA